MVGVVSHLSFSVSLFTPLLQSTFVKWMPKLLMHETCFCTCKLCLIKLSTTQGEIDRQTNREMGFFNRLSRNENILGKFTFSDGRDCCDAWRNSTSFPLWWEVYQIMLLFLFPSRFTAVNWQDNRLKTVLATVLHKFGGRDSDEALLINLCAYTARTLVWTEFTNRRRWERICRCFGNHALLTDSKVRLVQTKLWCMTELCFLLMLKDA